MTAEAVHKPLREAKLSAQVAQPLNPTVGFHFLLRPTSDEEPTGSRANDR
jgi:hypothetical protein